MTRSARPRPADAASSPLGTSTTETASMRRVATAGFVGSLVEFYDFTLYGVAAALVFGPVFFPALGPAGGVTAAFGTLGVAFVARPIGSVLFGHIGDRVGRKRTLVVTLVLMGLATVAVGLLPTPGEIGVAAPVALVVLRIVQGLAAGGEWAGAALFVTENAPRRRRGFWAMFTSLGAGVAQTVAPVSLLLVSVFMTDEQLRSWGWRIPFVASIVLVGVGLYIRLRMDETPVFAAAARSARPRMPFLEALRAQPREITLASLAMILPPSFGYLGASYLLSYGGTVLHYSSGNVLLVGVCSGVAFTVGIAIGGTWSDRIGRRRILTGAAVVGIVWALLLFPVVDAAPSIFPVGVCLTLFIAGFALGPMSAFISELFPTRYRYTAAGFSYSFAQIIGGGVIPLLAAAMVATVGGVAFGIVLAGLAAVALGGTLLLRETRHLEMNRADGPGAPGAEAVDTR